MEENTTSNLQVEILESTRLVDTFVKVDEDVIRHPRLDGKMTPPLSRIAIYKPHSIGVLLYHRHRNAFVLVQQFRYPAREDNGGWSTEIVAGNIDEGESIGECVKREALEETGYTLQDLVPIGQGYSSPGICNEKLYLFYSEVSEHDRKMNGGGLEEEGEDIVVKYCTVEEGWKLLEDHKIMDLKTQIALQWYFLHRENQNLSPGSI